MSSFVPRVYQKLIIGHILSHPRCALFVSMGMGKTSSTLAALEYLKLTGEPVCALILAPLRVAASTWPDEVKKWGFDLRVSAIVGTAAQRSAALMRPADVYCTNYENIPWLIKELGSSWRFNVIVADESTRLKSFRLGGGGSSRAKALSKVAGKAARFIELTGTPAPNGLLDLWGQLWFLDRGERLGRSFGVYTSVYFKPRRVGSSPWAVTYDPCDWARDVIQKKLSDICLSLDAGDYFPLEDPISVTVPVDLPPAARRVYDDLQRDMLAELDSGEEVGAVNAAAKTVKCLQVASGAVYHEDGESWDVLHDEKISALASIVEEAAGAPVLVAYHWKADLDRLKKAFPAGRELDRNPETIKAWNAGKIPLLFAHPASAGHGLNLQDGGNILVFFSHWWDLEQYQQIVERIGPTRQAQAGHPRAVFLYHIVARDTVDELVMRRRETKREVQDLLLESLKR